MFFCKECGSPARLDVSNLFNIEASATIDGDQLVVLNLFLEKKAKRATTQKSEFRCSVCNEIFEAENLVCSCRRCSQTFPVSNLYVIPRYPGAYCEECLDEIEVVADSLEEEESQKQSLLSIASKYIVRKR
jgi:hypothetical protein